MDTILKSLIRNFDLKAYVKCLSFAILNYDKQHVNSFISMNLLKFCSNEQSDEQLQLLEPLFIIYEPSLSDILKQSSIFNEKCELYELSPLNMWIENNPELFDTEVVFFNKILTLFEKYIKFDVVKYSYENMFSVNSHRRVSTQSEDEKLKQLYTVVHYYQKLNS